MARRSFPYTDDRLLIFARSAQMYGPGTRNWLIYSAGRHMNSAYIKYIILYTGCTRNESRTLRDGIRNRLGFFFFFCWNLFVVPKRRLKKWIKTASVNLLCFIESVEYNFRIGSLKRPVWTKRSFSWRKSLRKRAYELLVSRENYDFGRDQSKLEGDKLCELGVCLSENFAG